MMSCTETKKSEDKKEEPKGSVVVKKGSAFPVAYIDTDSLLRQYQLAINLQEDFLKKQEKSRTDFNEKAKKLQDDMNEFQRKVQNNGFLSRERAEQEQRSLVSRDQDLKSFNSKLSNELMAEQDKINLQLRDTITNYLEVLNADGKYQLILSNTMGDNVLYSAPGVNITQEVADALNARFEKSKAKK